MPKYDSDMQRHPHRIGAQRDDSNQAIIQNEWTSLDRAAVRRATHLDMEDEEMMQIRHRVNRNNYGGTGEIGGTTYLDEDLGDGDDSGGHSQYDDQQVISNHNNSQINVNGAAGGINQDSFDHEYSRVIREELRDNPGNNNSNNASLRRST